MYDMPVLQCTAYANKSIDYLCQEIKEHGIQLSVFAPRKIPFLFRLFEKAGGDINAAKEKNYAKDLRHMVLVRGLNLEERPVTPKPPPSTSPNLKGYPFNPAMPQQQQPMQNQQYINQQQAGVNHMPGMSNQGILQSALSLPQPPQPQENNTTLKGLLGKKPNPINQQNNWNFQVRGQMPVNAMPNQIQQNINPRFPVNPQQQQQLMPGMPGNQQQPLSMPGMPGMPGNVMPAQAGAGVMPGMGMTGGASASGMPIGGAGQAGGMPIGGASQTGGMPLGGVGQTSGMQIGGATQASGMPIGGAGQAGGMPLGGPGQGGMPMGGAAQTGGMPLGGAGQAGMMGGMGQRGPHPREREIIWSGELEWQEKAGFRLVRSFMLFD